MCFVPVNLCLADIAIREPDESYALPLAPAAGTINEPETGNSRIALPMAKVSTSVISPTTSKSMQIAPLLG